MTAALLISHGQPSDPDPAEADLAQLAQRVAQHLPGWHIGSATLAKTGSLARAVAEAGPQGRAYPLFMAGGWFTKTHLPAKLAEAGGANWTCLEPLGCDPRIHALAAQIAAETRPTDLILAAHGSFRSPAPADVAAQVARQITAETGIPSHAAFIDQDPRLQDQIGHGPTTACLPFFAASGAHVTEDIPAALATAGFQGKILPALGLHPEIPALIARAIKAGEPACSTCKWLSSAAR